FKCKMCGGDLETTDGMTVTECEYCGTKQTVASADNEKKVNLFNRANRLRMHSEFDKAGAIYEQIIAEFPEEAEAYWGLCLCNYGIEYVDDPATGNKIPTCHRASFEKLRKDANYELAIEYAEDDAAAVYQAQAKEIDRIMGEILSVSGKEEPYDIFICYKETDNSGERTPDSVAAQDIYDALTAKGYKVFFSRITLEDKLGQQYEPYIFAALNSARVMLAVGTDYEYFNAVWVKNEWSRFLKLMAKDKSKVLIPCYKDMDAYDMPDEFKGLQAQDMGKLGFVQDLCRGIDKLTGKTAESKKVTAETAVNGQPAGGGVDNLLRRMFMFLEDGDFKSATEYSNKVLDIDASNAEAYLGALMAEKKVRVKEKLKDSGKLLEKSDNYKKILRFGDDALINELKGYIEYIKRCIYEEAIGNIKYAESVENCLNVSEEFKNIRDFEDSAEWEYNAVMKALNCAKTDDDFSKVRKKLLSMNGYKDTAEYAEKCLNGAEYRIEQYRARIKICRDRTLKSSLEKEIVQLKKEMFSSEYSETEISGLENQIHGYESKRDELKNEINNLTAKRGSLGLFAGKEKKQIDVQISELQKQLSEIESVIADIQTVIDIKNTISLKEQKLLEIEKELNSAVPGETVASVLAEAFNESSKIKSAVVPDGIKFGSYFLNNKSANKPIEWQILDIKDGKALLISKYALDCQKYNKSSTDVTWENCSLRKWLNGTFLNNAFSSDEQAVIATTNVSTGKNPLYHTNPGNATTDKVFLLSIKEAEKYFTTDELRKCASTAYAKAQGAYTSKNYKTASGEAICQWWLRSPGVSQDNAAYVRSDGSVSYLGDRVDYGIDCVRPALWINLDSLLFKS
ncbi:MAG: DUF6273 domain-containing protein, partial [Clostridia bacterium]|nr:DUF6273 domain-containing protein [Clostridia bacterium]